MTSLAPPSSAGAPPTPGGVLRWALALTLVATGAALIAVGFRGLLELIYRSLFGASDIVTMVAGLPSPLRVLLPMTGGALAGWIASLPLARAGSSGVGAVMEAVVLGTGRLSLASTLLWTLGCWFAVLGGGSVGREGPIIQTGGTLGETAGRALGMSGSQTRWLIAAGTAAGFAAAYNAPVAAVLFVVEIVAGLVALDAVLPSIGAALIATLVVRACGGGEPLYGAHAFALPLEPSAQVLALLGCALLGVLAGLIGKGFMGLLELGEVLFQALPGPAWGRSAAGGALVGLLLLALPDLAGNGMEPLKALMSGKAPLLGLLALLLLKPLATTSSVSSGSPGGVFTPMMLVGGVMGAGLALMTGTTDPERVGAFALVGSAATTAATTHAPLMATVLAVELTGAGAMLVPLLLTTGIATLVSRRLGRDSLYRRELRRRGIAWRMTLDGRRVEQTGPGTGRRTAATASEQAASVGN